MKIWKIVLFAVVVLATSCSIQPKPKLQITHVLAVTHEGDTLKLPIDVIRPVNYRIINYSTPWNYGYNNWYHGGRTYHYDYSYGPSNRGSNNSNDKGSNKIVPREDPGDKKPSGDVLLKGKN